MEPVNKISEKHLKMFDALSEYYQLSLFMLLSGRSIEEQKEFGEREIERMYKETQK